MVDEQQASVELIALQIDDLSLLLRGHGLDRVADLLDAARQTLELRMIAAPAARKPAGDVIATRI
jgi:hypothetical protein